MPDMPGFITEHCAKLCAAIPAAVDVGFHLCYGDFQGKHFVEPIDTAKLVDVVAAGSEFIELVGGVVSINHEVDRLPVPGLPYWSSINAALTENA